MTIAFEPNPSTRKSEDFPKTTTLPEGWTAEGLSAGRAAAQAAEMSTPDAEPVRLDDQLFARRLDSFPRPNTLPEGWDLSEMTH